MAVKTIASSTLDVSAVTSGMTTLGVGQHSNTGATATSAPVLLSVQADQVVDATQFAKIVAESYPDLTSAFVARMLNLLNETVQDIIETATYAPNIDFGWGKFLFEIAGSLDTATQEPSALTNYPYFSGSVKSEYQRAFAQMDAYVATGANPCDLKRIRDKATAALNVIDGTNVFYIDGRGLSFGHTGESCALYDELGVTKKCDIAIDSAKSYDVSIACTLPNTATLAVGNYTVKMTSVIGGKQYPMTKNVKLVTAIAPTPALTKVVQGEQEQNMIFFGTPAAVFTGVIPGGFKATDELKLQGAPDAGGAYQGSMSLNTYVTASTETTITLGNGFSNDSGLPDSDWVNNEAKVTLIRDGANYPLTVQFVSM